MRPKKVSIGDLRDLVSVYRVGTSARTSRGGIIPTLTKVGEAYVDLRGEMKERQDLEGAIQYQKEYKIKARVGAFQESDQLWFGSDKISVIAINDANAGYIEAKGISIK